MRIPERVAHTFIIRVWLERAEDGARGEWRGEVQHVPSGRTLFFRELHTLGGILEQILTEAESA